MPKPNGLFPCYRFKDMLQIFCIHPLRESGRGGSETDAGYMTQNAGQVDNNATTDFDGHGLSLSIITATADGRVSVFLLRSCGDYGDTDRERGEKKIL